jgi:general secretion pathway protein D
MALSRIPFVVALLALSGGAAPAVAQRDSAVTAHGDSVAIRLIDVDVRAAVEAFGPYLDRPVVFGAMNAGRVTLQTPRPIPRRDVVPLLRSALESQGLEMVADSAGPYRIRPKVAVPIAPAPVAPAVPASGGPLQLFVIHLSHARAADVAATVNALYGRAGALGELGAGRPSSTLARELAQNQAASAGAMRGDASPPSALPGATPGRNASGTLSPETTIVPDLATNSLLVRATRADYELIAAAVKEIDVRPLQVLVEMVVAEVRRDRALSFGLDAVLPPTRVDGARVSGSQAGLGIGDLVIRVMASGLGDLDLTLRAAASRGDVSIVSRPAVVTANNEEAQILVGSQRPFVQVSRSLPTDAASRDQVVQYKDVGTKLTVRPTISRDGYVMLEVTQEISQATSEVQFDAPIISTRSVQTRLLLKDRQTVVMGGLRDQQREVTQSGVPILSAIPLLGGLFGRTRRTNVATELFLFITPRVLRTDDDAATLTEPLEERARKITNDREDTKGRESAKDRKEEPRPE